MSGVETLGFVCNIMQLISFACETTTLCKAVYHGRSPDRHLQEYAKALSDASSQVNSHCQGMRSQTSDEQALEIIASKCNIAARELDEEVKFLNGHQAKGNLTATLRTAVRTNWRKNRLSRLERTLESYKSSMETHLLMRTW